MIKKNVLFGLDEGFLFFSWNKDSGQKTRSSIQIYRRCSSIVPTVGSLGFNFDKSHRVRASHHSKEKVQTAKRLRLVTWRDMLTVYREKISQFCAKTDTKLNSTGTKLNWDWTVRIVPLKRNQKISFSAHVTSLRLTSPHSICQSGGSDALECPLTPYSQASHSAKST